MRPAASEPAKRAVKDKQANSSGDNISSRQAELEREIKNLKELAEYRSAFLSRLAHELRTPLTSILGFSEILLSQEELSGPQRNFCERIQNSAHQLQASLNQLTDLSRLEGGQSEVHREEFALDDLLRQSCAAVTPQAQKQNVTLRCESAIETSFVVSDREKLRQVVSTFLGNAISRSPNGAAVVVAAEENSGSYIIEIEDEGETPVELEALMQLDLSNLGSSSSDLALVISNHNIDLLGAKLRLQKRKPRGLKVLIQLAPSVPNADPR